MPFDGAMCIKMAVLFCPILRPPLAIICLYLPAAIQYHSVKRPAFAIIIFITATSCSSLKRSQGSVNHATAGEVTSGQHKDPQFIDHISIRSSADDRSSREPTLPTRPGIMPPVSLEIMYPEQFKYAILLDVPVEQMADRKLVDFLDDWYGTRYRLGGTDQSGVDCSAFVQAFMTSMYGVSVPRTSIEQYRQCRRIDQSELREGDLVFFKTIRHREVSHVGVYLCNNKFVHASTSSGVMISDLSEPYFSSHYVGAGRYVKDEEVLRLAAQSR